MCDMRALQSGLNVKATPSLASLNRLVFTVLGTDIALQDAHQFTENNEG